MSSGVRLASIDVLRGSVMVLMALDHARDFFSSARFDPTDLSRATLPLFVTRYVTHFCAPVFVLLAGSSAYFLGSRGLSGRQLSRFLAVRGLWLVLLELTVVRFGWFFDLRYDFLMGQVIWALGWSMVALALLCRLPLAIVGTLGVVGIAGHNLLDGLIARDVGPYGWVLAVLHTGEPFEIAPGVRFYPVYPLLPWIGVMALGFALGPLLRDDARRRKGVLALGAVAIVLFVALRLGNAYGDPRPWGVDPRPGFTVASFFNCEKYPPSLAFLLMTLGPALVALGMLEDVSADVLRTFGRVPLFYYLVHIPFLHALAYVFAFARYGTRVLELSESNLPADYGFGLPVVYAVWMGAVAALYLPCRWFEGLKARHPGGLLRYL